MENIDNMVIGDKTLKQWEEEMQAPPISSEVSYEDAEQLGFMSPEDRQQPQEESGNKFYNTLDAVGVEHPEEGKQYEKLSLGESWADAGKSLLVEASHVLMPKDWEIQYESRTKFGEITKYLYRYGMGTAALMASGGTLAGAKVLANAGKLGKAGQVIGKLLSGQDLIKTGANATKAAQIGARIGNASLGGAISGAIADFNLYRPEENEGHMADAFGDVDNAFVSWLQTDENDTDIDAKLKNVVEGFFMGIGVGNAVEFALKPLFKKGCKAIKALRNGKTEAAQEVVETLNRLEKTANTADLIEQVKKIREEAIANNQDASQMLIDRLHPEDNVEAQKMLKLLDDGEDIFVHQDGTWDISVNKWDDAHKVSPEEYRKQSLARDEAAGGYAGDTAIAHQDAAVRETWTNRGWMGENESLITETKTGVKGNTKLANSITKNYKDKWQIDNNIKVEFVDGLKVRGQAVEGTTSKTTYEGKTTKTNQNAIDKKKLQIQKIKDKITMAEGGNAEVTDPLDVLKEELRIANNELKELQKAAKGENKIPNITIKIDVNAKNPYATLRAELEHARDIAKGEVPKGADVEGSGVHFSRYVGDDEGEVASGYVYKKAQGKAKAVSEATQENNKLLELNRMKENTTKVLTDGYSFREEPTETFSGEGYRVDIDSPSGANLGYVEYTIIDGNLHLDQAMNSSHGTDYYEKGVVPKIIDYIISSHPDVKTIVMDATTKEGRNLKARFIKEYPELGNKTKGISTQEELDASIEKDYNAREGVVNGSSNNNVSESKGDGRKVSDTNSAIDFHSNGEQISTTTKTQQGFVEDDVVGSSTRTDATGENTSSTVTEPQQLKIDFTQNLETKQSTEEVVNGLVNGEVKPTTKADIEALVTKVEQTDPDVAGFNWEAVIENPEKYTEDIERVFTEEDSSGLTEALAKGDITSLETIIKKELAAVKIMGEFYNIIKNKGLDIADDVKIAVIDTIQHLGNYIKGVKSGFGTGLQAQKGINEILESYGATRLSSWTKEGIDVFSQKMVNALNDIISLNFTRGKKLTPLEIRQQLTQALFEDAETHGYIAFLQNHKDIAEAFAKEIEKILQKSGTITVEEGKQALHRTLTLPEYNAMLKAAQLAPDKESWIKTLKNWCDGQGGITSYYVHNLLSGIGSLAKNIGSGAANTLYFPAKKILASYDRGLDAETQLMLRNEGWNTFKNLKQSCKESWQLMKEAFISGEGKLTDIGEQTLNMDEGSFKGFHKWEIHDLEYYLNNPKEIWTAVQNFHSIMTRAMGATDEFMSQVNYRSICRAKALNEATLYAEKAGKLGDETWINEEAQRIFDKKFDKHGKPTDVEALNEARTILYQNNLDGTMYNYQTGAKEKMRDTTLAMEVAGKIQHYANKSAFVKCMFPFVKTGANILQMALDHNIFYMYGSPAQRALLTSKTTEGALARSQCAFGAFSLCIGMMAAFNGRITGSAPSDPKERKALFATGWRPYSFKFGDTYVSYQGYEPIHGMLGFAADCANMWSTVTNPEDEKRVQHFTEQIIPTLVTNFLDKAAFRTGLKQLDLIMNPRDTEEWSKAMAQTFKGFLPDVAMVTNLRSVGEHDVMQPQTMYERVFYRYFPNLWQPKDHRRNVFGEKQSITGLLISTAGSQDGSPEEEALEYLAKYGYSPSEIDDVIANTGLKISDFKDPDTGRSALDAMKEEMSTVIINGMTLREAVRVLVESEEYQSLPDGVDIDTGTRWGAKEDTKINAINSVFLMYKQRAKKNIMADMDYYIDSNGRTLDDAKTEVQLKRLEHLNSLY